MMSGRRPVVITGWWVTSAFGRGVPPLAGNVFAGTDGFAPVTRFDTGRRRVHEAAALPGSPVLADELADAVDRACRDAGLGPAARADCPLVLACRADPDAARSAEPRTRPVSAFAGELAGRTGLRAGWPVYTGACVAGGTALADAAGAVAAGRIDAAVVAGGYLVDPDQFALFDAGRALATDGRVRPFSADRTGLLLGDAVVAVVLEGADAADRRGVPVLARLSGWGRGGDGYHVCQPRPDGAGLARAVSAALRRAGLDPQRLDYVNAHGTGTPANDTSEVAALTTALGPAVRTTPVSSTKSVHGHALEASVLLELVVTGLALREGRLPVNAGFRRPDPDCPLDLVVEAGRTAPVRHALSINSAFGGASTALVVSAP